MRSGFVCRRRRASASSASACFSKWAISASRWALLRLAEAVQLEPDIPALDQTEVLPEGTAHQDLLGVDVRPGMAEGLDVDLVELAVASLLRPLMAKQRHLAPQAQRPVVERVVLDHRPHDSGGGLRPERQPVAVHRVLERVHLLLDDVGHLAEATHEERRRLDDRRAHVAVGIALHQGADARLEPFPARRFGRQDVVHAFDRAQDVAHVQQGGVDAARIQETAAVPNRFSM
jgi:hypothetical protein